MKLEVAIAALMTTKALSCELFSPEFKSRALAENDGKKMKMIELFSQLNAGSGRKNSAFRKLRQERQHDLSNSAMQGQQQRTDNANGLDLGILGSGGYDFDENYRRLDEGEDEVCPTDEELVEYGTAFHAQYYAVPWTRWCQDIQEIYPDACNACEFPQVFDNETGLETGAYHMKIDCPGLIDVVNCTCIAFMEPMCEEDALFPDSGAVCETCNSDYKNWVIDNEYCAMTEETRIGLEANNGVPADVDEFVEEWFLADEFMVSFFFPACSASEMFSTPMSTILRVGLMGASLLWAVA